jgi:hypothetical protein
MSKASLGTIAALLRHSGTGLVKRYAHFDPDHLGKEVEMVSAFGKDRKPEGNVAEKPQFPDGTVTGTATAKENETSQNA